MTMNLINIFKREGVLCCSLIKLDFHCEYIISFLFKQISVVIKIGNIFSDIKSLAGNKVTQALINCGKIPLKTSKTSFVFTVDS